MGSNISYSNEEILTGLREHMIDNKCSKYSMHKPMTWNGILKRMKQDNELEAKVHNIVAQHESLWERIGIEALENKDENFNVPLFKMYAGNKKAFQSYETNELEQRIEYLENEQNK